MENIFVTYYDMPCTIASYVVSNNDMTYTIVINSRMAIERQKEAYMHELDHIKNGDYEKKCDIDFIEINAHNKVC